MARVPEPTPSTVHRLFAASGNRCMHPDCEQPLFDPATGTKLGKVAHIHAASEGGPRWDASLSAEDVRSYENLLLLCGPHHDIVDGAPDQYPPGLLRSWRDAREREAQPVAQAVLARPDVFAALVDWALEAGYARGLGLPVIFTCHQDDLENAHFDTRNYNQLAWTKAEELAKKLENRIVATIGLGPHKASKR